MIQVLIILMPAIICVSICITIIIVTAMICSHPELNTKKVKHIMKMMRKIVKLGHQ